MNDQTQPVLLSGTPAAQKRRPLWRSLFSSGTTAMACLWLLLIAVAMASGSTLLGSEAITVDLINRNVPPGLGNGWINFLGTDSLGRSVLARLAVASVNSVAIALCAVSISLLGGLVFGIVAGYVGGAVEGLIMRVTDMILGFPTLLLALIVLYIFGPSITNLVVVLSITRMPAYIRVARAEVLELRERLFVDASRTFGAPAFWILRVHILPLVLPTLLTLAAVNVAIVMLFEASLSFLGLGIQPPAVSWGLMVAQGRAYLGQAWWLACFPGLAIMLTTLSFNLLASWFRTANDPTQRWRLERTADE